MKCSLWTCSKSLIPYSILFVNNNKFILGCLPGPVFLLLFLSPTLTDFLKMDWLYLLSVQGILFSNTTAQKHQLFGTQLLNSPLSHPYMTTGKTITLTRQTFVGKIMSLLFDLLSRLVMFFPPRRNIF